MLGKKREKKSGLEKCINCPKCDDHVIFVYKHVFVKNPIFYDQ